MRPATRFFRGLALGAVLATLACSDDATSPEPPPAALRFRAISAGYYHTCALTAEGRAWCWGRNDFGTLGDGTRVQRDRPAPVAGGPVLRSLDAGAGHNCGLTAAGQAWCWGHDDEGQLGDGGFAVQDHPVQVAGGLAFTAVSAGHAHTCALTAAGDAWCWGDDSRGQLGNGPGGPSKSAMPVRVASDQQFAAISAGWYQTCAVTLAGQAWCWGAGESGQNGDGGTADRDRPVAVTGGRSFSSLSVGDRFVCGISSGEAWCWGANRQGELGSTGQGSAAPVRVAGTASLQQIAAGNGSATLAAAAPYACALRSNGALTCWGGEVRALRPADAAPAALAPGFTATAIAAGAQHVCILDGRGYAWCGGANYAAQLGDASTSDRAALVGVHGP